MSWRFFALIVVAIACVLRELDRNPQRYASAIWVPIVLVSGLVLNIVPVQVALCLRWVLGKSQPD